MNFTYQNKRSGIGAPDKLFGVSSKAKERIAQIGRENVIDSTIGVLLADDGRLVVLDSVDKCVKALRPDDYAPYAPILGTPDYIEAVKKAVFLDQMPQKPVAACYTPGGTGAIRNAVSAYTQPGDAVLTSDWHWSPYKTISEEIGRTLTTYTLFDSENKFNAEAFEKKLAEVLDQQDQAFIIINTPAHNPTGYTFTLEDWDKVLAAWDEICANDTTMDELDDQYRQYGGIEGANSKAGSAEERTFYVRYKLKSTIANSDNDLISAIGEAIDSLQESASEEYEYLANNVTNNLMPSLVMGYIDLDVYPGDEQYVLVCDEPFSQSGAATVYAYESGTRTLSTTDGFEQEVPCYRVIDRAVIDAIRADYESYSLLHMRNAELYGQMEQNLQEG